MPYKHVATYRNLLVLENFLIGTSVCVLGIVVSHRIGEAIWLKDVEGYNTLSTRSIRLYQTLDDQTHAGRIYTSRRSPTVNLPSPTVNLGSTDPRLSLTHRMVTSFQAVGLLKGSK